MQNDHVRPRARGILARALFGGALAAAVVVGLAGCSAGSSDDATRLSAASIGTAGETAASDAGAGQAAKPEPTAKPTSTPKPTAKPKITHKSVDVVADIPFSSSTVDDPSRAAGETAVVTAGRNGASTTTWDVAYSDGVETGRTKVSEKTTTEPVTEVTAVGSKQPAPAPAAPAPAEAAADCDPNYEGACVPIDSDVDCAGGSGNGPSYVEGPVRVVGDDIYNLDGNGDGVGCE